MTRDKFPERVPFRLTRMLVAAMEVCGLEGNFRATAEGVMRVLRQVRGPAAEGWGCVWGGVRQLRPVPDGRREGGARQARALGLTGGLGRGGVVSGG